MCAGHTIHCVRGSHHISAKEDGGFTSCKRIISAEPSCTPHLVSNLSRQERRLALERDAQVRALQKIKRHASVQCLRALLLTAKISSPTDWTRTCWPPTSTTTRPPFAASSVFVVALLKTADTRTLERDAEPRRRAGVWRREAARRAIESPQKNLTGARQLRAQNAPSQALTG